MDINEAVRDLTAAPTNGLPKSKAREILKRFALEFLEASVPDELVYTMKPTPRLDEVNAHNSCRTATLEAASKILGI